MGHLNIYLPTIIFSIGWTLINSIWFGFSAYMLYFISINIFPKISSRIKHNIAYIAMIFIFLSLLSNFLYVAMKNNVPNPKENILQIREQRFINITEEKTAENEKILSIIQKAKTLINEHLIYFVLFWFTGLSFLSFKTLGGLLYLRFILKNSKYVINEEFQQKVSYLSKTLNIKKKITLQESKNINSPMVFGFIKPVILLPLGFILQASENEVEMIILHELAHIQRNDFVLNFIQRFLEIILFFNPFVWLLTREISHERENACDDIAISFGRKNKDYAKALMKIAEMQVKAPEMVLLLQGKKNNLLERIGRIMGKNNNSNFSITSLMIMFGLMIFFTLIGCGILGNKNAVAEDRESDTETVIIESKEDNKDKDQDLLSEINDNPSTKGTKIIIKEADAIVKILGIEADSLAEKITSSFANLDSLELYLEVSAKEKFRNFDFEKLAILDSLENTKIAFKSIIDTDIDSLLEKIKLSEKNLGHIKFEKFKNAEGKIVIPDSLKNIDLEIFLDSLDDLDKITSKISKETVNITSIIDKTLDADWEVFDFADTFDNIILKELKNDELIPNDEKDIELSFKNNTFSINGKIQNEEVTEKYRKLFEKHFGSIKNLTVVY